MIVEATGLGLRTRRGWVFRDVDLRVETGEVVALTGPPGSGRTSLLLALAGRFVTTTGRLTRTGAAALGHVPGVHEPEPALTVAEHLDEGLLLRGVSGRAHRRRRIEQAIADASGFSGVALDPAARGRDLTPLHRQVLGLALATLHHPALIVADDVDAGLDRAEREQLWAALTGLAGRGYALIAAARETEPAAPVRAYPLGAAPPTGRPEAGEAPAADNPAAPEVPA